MIDIKGYEGLYAVTEDGKVYNYKTKRFLHGSTGGGYVSVELFKDGKSKWLMMHRIVAEAYIPNPNNYPIVHHIDECKNHNWVSNLMWCTQKQNLNFGTSREKLSKANTGKKHTEETKQKLRESHMGAKNPNYGKPRSAETRRKISETLRKNNGLLARTNG